MQLDMACAAGWTVLESEEEGPRVIQWRPFTADGAQNRVLRRTVSPLAAADEIPGQVPA